MILRLLALALLALAVLAVCLAAYVRLSPMAEEVWDVDPEAAGRTGKPNDYLVGPGGDREAVVTETGPRALDTLLAGYLARQDGTEALGGAVDGDTIRRTWVQRSRLMGYPDALTYRITPEGEGSRLVIYSRSRFGRSDLGVNRDRVERMLSALDLQ